MAKYLKVLPQSGYFEVVGDVIWFRVDLEVRSPSMECFGDCRGAEIPRIGASECVEATVVSMNTFREL